jgi:hypothetical protein
LSPGGRAFLDRAPNAADEVFLKIELQQNMPYAGRCGLFLDVFIRIAGNQDDRGIEMLVPQTIRQLDAAHGRHLVVDHKAVGLAHDVPVQDGGAVAKRPNVETVGFKQESQRSEYVGIVVDDINHLCSGRRRHRGLSSLFRLL